MITRKPREASSAAWPKRIQLVSASENRPWRRMTGRPSASPSSCQAISTPSSTVKLCLVGELANGLVPAIEDAPIMRRLERTFQPVEQAARRAAGRTFAETALVEPLQPTVKLLAGTNEIDRRLRQSREQV